MAAAGVAKLLDVLFTLALAGFERAPLVAKAREMEAAGATMDEITDALRAMTIGAEETAQGKIDAAPE